MKPLPGLLLGSPGANNKVKEAAKSIYDAAEYLGRWQGYNVYTPTLNDDEPRCIGFPQFILAKGGALRWTCSVDESQKIMRRFFQ